MSLHPNAKPRMGFVEFFGAVIDFKEHFYHSGKAVGGKAKLPSVAMSALKVVEEFGEFAGEVVKRGTVEKREEEFADALFALLHLGLVAEINITSAMHRVATKNYSKFDTHMVNESGIIVKRPAEDHVVYGQSEAMSAIFREVIPAPTNPPTPPTSETMTRSKCKPWWKFRG